jgi:hypothetical protein
MCCAWEFTSPIFFDKTKETSYNQIFVYLQSVKVKTMTTIELKKVLIHRITEIDDESFLNAIKTILDTKSKSQILTLTDEQRKEIIESKKQIEEGLFIEQSDMDKKFNLWQSAR